MKKATLIIIIIVLFVLAGCSTGKIEEIDGNMNDKLNVVTTIFPLYEFAKEVGGEKVEVTLLLPPGAEPHSYEPKASDIKKMESADAFIYIGEIMEPWAHDIISGTNNKNIEVIEASSLVTLLSSTHDHAHAVEDDHAHAVEDDHAHAVEDDHAHAVEDDHAHETENIHLDETHDNHDHGVYDPHIWLDLENDQQIVKEIARVFSLLDNNNSETYNTNANNYNAKLRALDQRYRNELSSCKQEEFIVGGHNFFGYIEHRYNLEGISAIENLEPNTEPTPKRIQEIMDITNEHGIKYVLTEVLVSKQMAEAIASESGAKVLTFNPASNLAKMDFDKGVSFISVMEENLGTLKIALECN